MGINHGDSLRIEELTPWENEQYGGGKGTKYAQFIVETLKPFIDKNYRTLPDKKNTGVMGSSLGGLISFYMGLKYQDVFGVVGVFSPSFWFSDNSYKMAEDFRNGTSLKMYVLAGGKEHPGFEEQVKKMEQIFREKGFPEKKFFLKIVEEGTHSETFWRKEFPEAIEWLFIK